MKRFIIFLLVVTIFIVPSILMGGSKEKVTTEEIVPITILINSSPWLPGFKALVNLYTKETGNKVILNITPFPGMLQKSRNAVQASTSEFDIINLNEQWYMLFYANGFVTPIKEIDPNFKLDPNIIEYEWATRWDPKVHYSTKNGEIYGLPINGNIQLYFYRKDLLKEKGFKVPKTWAEVEKIASAFYNPPKMYGYVIRTAPSDWELQGMISSFGGSVIKLDEKTGEWEVTIAQKPALEALKTWLRLGRKYGPKNYASIGQSDMLALMASGKLVQTVMVGAAAPNFDNPQKSVVIGKIGASVEPGKTPEQRATMSGIWVMGIPHNLPMKRKKSALTFLKWALTKKAQLAYAKAGGIPVRQDVYEELSNDPKLGWWMKAMAESTPYIHAQPRIPEAPQIFEIIDRTSEDAVLNKLSPEDALKKAAKEIYKLLVDNGYKVKSLNF